MLPKNLLSRCVELRRVASGKFLPTDAAESGSRTTIELPELIFQSSAESRCVLEARAANNFEKVFAAWWRVANQLF
jgi:hypothetical protein